ncbi:MAG: DUF58 domain-containing protein [Labilithrix sp.]|nr:DUF58 domain-containing protein [Labilithrix sp.]MCW5811944.1 DUF58 domain-containing protein [Labilithrix sp.]
MSAAARQNIRRTIDWGSLAPLRIRARLVAEGVYAGAHRSARKGAGVEFGGHRAYTPGDDLRHLDMRSLLRHDHLLVRQFETETDRALRLVVDASASMGYRGSRAPGAKLAWAGLVAAALARVAVKSGDPIGMSFIGGSKDARNVPVRGGREVFERVVDALEGQVAEGEAMHDLTVLDNAIGALARNARRGSVVVVLSDLLDLPAPAPERIGAIATRGCVVVVVQVLDPDEADFPFNETVRLKSLEGGMVVETDEAARERYLAALAAEQATWREKLLARGAKFLTMRTDRDPVSAVRAIVEASL